MFFIVVIYCFQRFQRREIIVNYFQVVVVSFFLFWLLWICYILMISLIHVYIFSISENNGEKWQKNNIKKVRKLKPRVGDTDIQYPCRVGSLRQKIPLFDFCIKSNRNSGSPVFTLFPFINSLLRSLINQRLVLSRHDDGGRLTAKADERRHVDRRWNRSHDAEIHRRHHRHRTACRLWRRISQVRAGGKGGGGEGGGEEEGK